MGGRARAKWNAAAHPRGPDGRFISLGGGGGGRSSTLGSNILGTLARNAATAPSTPNRRGTAAQRLATQPKGGAWSAMAKQANAFGGKPRRPAKPKATPKKKPENKVAAGGGRAAVEQDVRKAYAELARMPGDWVPLAEIRDRLSRHDRADVDAALESLAMQPGAQIIPWDNAKALTARDHAAALHFGGEDNHNLRIEPEPAPAPRDAAQIMQAAGKPKPRKAATPKTPAPPRGVEAAKADIRDAVAQLAREPGGWVTLARLRDALGQRHDQATVDQALRQLNREPDVNLVPESNQKTLSGADRVAAVNIGDRDKHLISIQGVGGTPPAPSAAAPRKTARAKLAKGR
jgi:hypothetical protein